MRKRFLITISTLLFGTASLLQAENSPKDTLVVTSSNTSGNKLLVYDSRGDVLQTLSTGGQGGVSGNAGGIAVWHDTLAVVNYGSNSVSIFKLDCRRFHLWKTIDVLKMPVSLAFGHDHLYVLGATHVESHRLNWGDVSSTPDGTSALYLGDGSAAQVGVLPEQLIVSEKNNVIETLKIDGDGAVAGPAELVKNIPANVNAPFGLITRGNDAYVTIAHADEISLVRNGEVLTVTPSMTQHAPCWLALRGPFLFSSNSPSHTVSRYAVYGKKIVQDEAIVAQLNGAPTDIAAKHSLAAVVDSNGTVSHLSIFSVDEDGNFTLVKADTIDSAANGVALVEAGR